MERKCNSVPHPYAALRGSVREKVIVLPFCLGGTQEKERKKKPSFEGQGST